MKHLLISGYYGFGNTGDEAILSGMIQQIKEKIPYCNFVVVSGNPEETKRMHSVDAISRIDFPRISQEIDKSDLVIVGGGGLFQDHHKIEISSIFTQPGLGIASYAIVPLMASMHLKPVMFYSQGFGPLFSKESKIFVSYVCDFADIITVRDLPSKELLEDLGVNPEKIILTIDPALGLIPASKERVKEIFKQENIDLDNKEIVCVSVRQWIDKSLEEKYIDHIARALQNFLDSHDAHLIFLPFQVYNEHNNDIEVETKIIEKLNDKSRCNTISKVYDPREMAGIIAEADLVIGMRYHSMIFAALSNIPVVALSYDPKVTNLMKDLDLEEFCMDIFSKDIGLLKKIIENAWKNRTEIKKRLDISLGVLKTRNYDPSIVHSFLGGPKVNELYTGVDINSQIYVSDKIYKLKSIETIHYQAKLLSSLQLEHQNQIDSYKNQIATYKNQINNLQIEYQNQNHILKSEITAIYSMKSWKLVTFMRKCIDAPKSLIFEMGAGILPELIKKPLRRVLFKHLIIQSKEPLPDDLNQFFKEVNEKGKQSNVVLVLSATKFVENEGQRSTRIAKELASRGNYVLFAYWRWTPDDCADFGKTNDNIFLLPIDQLLNFSKQILEFEYSKEISKVFLMEFPHPYFFELLSLSNSTGWVTVYDVLDDWEEFHKVGQANWFDKDLEQYFTLNSDIVTAVSPALVEKIRNYDTRAVKLLPNAVDPDVLSDKPSRPLKKGKITIGYFGHLTSAWFDWDLIIKLANKHSEWVFHIIGYGEQKISLPANILILGKVEPQELSSYAKNWDVAIIPFKISNLSKSVDPIKIYEYLYFRLPVVVQGIHHLERYPYVLIANNFEEFEKSIEKASKLHIDEVDIFIEDNNWKKRVDSMLEEINKVQNEDTFKNCIA